MGKGFVVTHDRAMLENLATDVLALDGRGGATMHASLFQALAGEAAQREATPSQAKTPKKSEPRAAVPQARAKLGYLEQREYDGMERRIEDAEARVSAATAQLTETDVVADHAAMAAACESLSRAQAEVTTLYARWEELEAKIPG